MLQEKIRVTNKSKCTNCEVCFYISLNQIWIANHWESPLHNGIDTVAMGPYVNWSSSYRYDSHIVTPYGHVEPLPASTVNKNTTLVDYSAGKTKQVAWFASNCYDKNGRKNYAYELSRLVNSI